MVKKAARSVRISASTKAAIDKAAANRRSTASLVEIILRDWARGQITGRKKYPSPDELGPDERLMDMLLPTGKTVGQSTKAELKALGKAYQEAVKWLEANRKAAVRKRAR